ncbi:MAG: glycosyltransferase family 2 protein [Gammaproteobacteria bacterium]|nr:glycosyltransferase family 2 protein [Gammaproteobacteria bacterium]
MTTEPLNISVIVPCHNEAQNIPLLLQAIREALVPLGHVYEVIITDDASSDESWQVLSDLSRSHPELVAQRLQENRGQSAACWAGMMVARGDYLVTLDADLQNDPVDMPRLLEGLARADCVCGTRVESRSKGDNLVRVYSSRIANWVRNRLSGENISDAGCCYRAFRRECIGNLKYFRGMHRFLPTLFKIEGFSVVEVPVSTNPRRFGSAHYGVWNRLFASFYDLLAVRWMQSRMGGYRVAERVGGETRSGDAVRHDG